MFLTIKKQFFFCFWKLKLETTQSKTINLIIMMSNSVVVCGNKCMKWSRSLKINIFENGVDKRKNEI